MDLISTRNMLSKMLQHLGPSALTLWRIQDSGFQTGIVGGGALYCGGEAGPKVMHIVEKKTKQSQNL